MWNISRTNGGHAGVHTRQYSTMPGHLLNKTLPGPVNFLSGLCNSFDCMHKISTQKRFGNPNFVNERNPNLHSYQPTAASTLVEKCSFFATGTQNSCCPEVQKQSETPAQKQTCQVEGNSEAKENSKRKKMTKRKPKRSTSSPRKGNKGKAKSAFHLKYEVDEIGLDPLSDSYDSDLCSSPAIDLSSSPLPCLDGGNVPCIEYSISIAAIPESKPKSTVVISINKPKISGCRSRVPSDCGSEDSFVVFQCSPEDVFDISEEDEDEDENDEDEDEEMDTDTESDSDDDLDNSSYSESNFAFKTEDVVDFGSRATRKRVRFADDLFVVHPMHCWSFAYREARSRYWEIYALDRARFKDRVQELESVLGPILEPAHRQKIFEERFARTQDQSLLLSDFPG